MDRVAQLPETAALVFRRVGMGVSGYQALPSVEAAFLQITMLIIMQSVIGIAPQACRLECKGIEYRLAIP